MIETLNDMLKVSFKNSVQSIEMSDLFSKFHSRILKMKYTNFILIHSVHIKKYDENKSYMKAQNKSWAKMVKGCEFCTAVKYLD